MSCEILSQKSGRSGKRCGCTMVSSRAPEYASPWIPLGSAQIVDWKHLGRSSSARGATAWSTKVGAESVLLRSWSNESTTFYEFYFLAYEGCAGTVVVSTGRPEPTRLRLKATVDVPGRLGYSDIIEFEEHPLTGLHGSTIRTVEFSQGRMQAEHIRDLTSADAEVLEYAPESALLTSCGWWLHSVLDAVRAQLLDGELPVERAAQDGDNAASSNPEPPRSPKQPPPPPPPSRQLSGPDGKVPSPGADVEKPEPRRPSKKKKSKKSTVLVASTNSGDHWEIRDPETFIGRSKQCSIVLKSQRVSRKHATVTLEEDGFYINDLGAANGIWVGTEKIDRERIEDGAEYIIGDVLVTFSHQ